MRSPRLSVVLCTYNRASIVGRAIDGVLAQRFDGFELVVVDDGSTDGTAALLDALDDPRVRVVHRPNGGLCAARNTGLGTARGGWVVFLDDDDVPQPGWLDALGSVVDDPRYGLASCGARYVDPGGRPAGGDEPHDLGPVFDGTVALHLSGAFAARRDLLDAVGGYADGLGAAHQFELFVRLVGEMRQRGVLATADPRALLVMQRRAPAARPVVNPRMLFDGSRWVLARHPLEFAGSRPLRAHWQAVIGVNAARIGDWPRARRHLARSAGAEPWEPRRWGRLALVLTPPLAERIWGRAATWASHDAAEIGVPRQLDSSATTGRRELFLPWRYRENPVASLDAAGTPYWAAGLASTDIRMQDPVYRLAARLVRRHALSPVVDVGCGSGHKLVRRVGAVTDEIVGADQPSAIAVASQHFPDRRWVSGDLGADTVWDELAAVRPRLVVCLDVIEHLDDPVELLHRLHRLVGPEGRLLLSTPDRARLERSAALGPPANPRHVREWTPDEMELLLLSTGFREERRWHLLPRSYSRTRTELNRTIHRALHLKAVPDRRTCMVFLLARATPRNSSTPSS